MPVGVVLYKAVLVLKLSITYTLQLMDRIKLSGVRELMGRVQWAGSIGPLGLGLGIRSSPYLGVK
jgi:hypothetical protein